MQRVVLDMQNLILADAIRMAFKKHGDFQVEIAGSPQETVSKSFMFAATVVIMEVTGYTPWKFCERMKIRDEIKQKCENCKIALLVHENAEPKVAEEVKKAKKDGLIDLFIYGSSSTSFLTALVDTL